MNLRNDEITRDREKFKQNNGTILRMTVQVLPCAWFTKKDLKTVLAAEKMTANELNYSLNYLEGAGYIEGRLAETRAKVSIADFDEDLLELKLTAEGTKVIMGFVQDNAVEI